MLQRVKQDYSFFSNSIIISAVNFISSANIIKVVVPQIRFLEKKFFYDFKIWNDIISRVLWKKKNYSL